MKPDIERFLEKISVSENGCWEWGGSKDTCGYGQIRINSVKIGIHRFIFEYYYGAICPDLTIDHLCRNRKCANPLHLEQVPQKVNLLRGIAPAAINARKTHCIHGHEFNETNTYYYKNGHRMCKPCRNYWQRNNKDKVHEYYIKHYAKKH